MEVMYLSIQCRKQQRTACLKNPCYWEWAGIFYGINLLL